MAPLGFTEKTVPEGQHVCYIFSDDAERLEVMAKYVESGMLADEKILYLADAMTPDEMRQFLRDSGIELPADGEGFELLEASAGYCPSGTFDVEEMLGIVGSFYDQAIEEGFAGARIAGETNWCLDDGGVDRAALMEYEARVTGVLAEHASTACCQYDARLFDGEMIFDLLRVHPMMIIQGQLVQNPFYVKPEVFLAEYQG